MLASQEAFVVSIETFVDNWWEQVKSTEHSGDNSGPGVL